MRKPLPHCLTALCAVLLSLRISAQTTSLPAASQTDSDTIRITHINPLRGALSGTGFIACPRHCGSIFPVCARPCGRACSMSGSLRWLHVGKFPDAGGKMHDLVIREGQLGLWQNDAPVPDHSSDERF